MVRDERLGTGKNAVMTNTRINLLGIDPFANGVQMGLLPIVEGTLLRPTFVRLTCRIPFPDLPVLRPVLARGDLHALAQLTLAPARNFAEFLWSKAGPLSPDATVNDSPSAFSLNIRGHGRRGERLGYPETSLQMTPSLRCGSPHEGSGWGFIPVGIAVFMACLTRGGNFSAADWEDALTSGLHVRLAASQSPIVREGCPSAQIGEWRSSGRAHDLISLLRPVASEPAISIVIQYLQQGVRAVKRRGPLFDSADTVVAALSALPHTAISPTFREWLAWPFPAQRRVKWASRTPQAELTEGTFVLAR